jgi:hypothetical protein
MEEEHDDSQWRTSRYHPSIPLGMPRAVRVEFGREHYRILPQEAQPRPLRKILRPTSCRAAGAVAAMNNKKGRSDVCKDFSCRPLPHLTNLWVAERDAAPWRRREPRSCAC